jgi:1L-myo-inositol 1-phosphate cytidylyltransferase / CDP-L-myo-inositol myo-inositolphosphotransferase
MVLLPDAGASPAALAIADGGEPKVLGLGLARRTVMEASRAGYSRIYLLARERAAPAGITAISNWSSLADACAMQPGPLIITHASILAEPDWLTRLTEIQTEPARWAAKTHKMILIAAPAVASALAALEADKGAYDLTAVQERLTRHFGAPRAIPAAIDPLVVSTSADVNDAEWRLLRGLVKDTDGFMARNVERPISLRIARRLASTGITPNQITLLSVGIGLCGALSFLSAHWLWQTAGALLFLAHSILDGCDGELARLRFQESRFGGIIDYWGDNVVHIAVFACMAIGWSLSIGASWPLLLGAAAALGNLGSAWFVYWRMMHTKKETGPLFTSVATVPGQTLARMLDAASRRDFIYLVLFLALFGKSNWFLVLAAAGAPIFFLLLLLLAVRERFQTA